MQRRTFLGAAAAVASLPSEVQDSSDTDVSEAPEPVRRSYDWSLWSATELFAGGVDEETGLSVNGYHLPDEPEECGVEILVSNRTGQIVLSLPSERAREVAEDLVAAADFAESGVKDA